MTEDGRMLFVKLPPNLQEQVVREQAKRQEKRPWVMIAHPTNTDVGDVTTALEL